MVFQGKAERASSALIVVVVVKTGGKEVKHCDGFRESFRRANMLHSILQPLQQISSMLCFLLFRIKKIKGWLHGWVKKIISVKMQDEFKYKAFLVCHQNAYQSRVRLTGEN